jgi:hypothetical protein
VRLLPDGTPAPEMSGEDRVGTIENFSHATLPTPITLGLADSNIDDRDLRRAATVLARHLDVPPAWLLRPVRVPGPYVPGVTDFGAPAGLTEYRDPVTGGLLSLETARRVIKPYEPLVMRQILGNLAMPTLAQPGRPGFGDQLAPPQAGVDPGRVAAAFKALAPVDGQATSFQDSLGAAVALARSSLDLDRFRKNLSVTAGVPGLSVQRQIAVAEVATVNNTPLRDPLDVLALAFPRGGGAAAGAGEYLQAARATRSTGAPGAGQAAAQLEQLAAGMPGYQIAEAGLGIAPGTAPPGQPSESPAADVLAAEGRYAEAAAALGKQMRLDGASWANSFLGRTVGKINHALGQWGQDIQADVVRGAAVLAYPLNLLEQAFGARSAHDAWTRDLATARLIASGRATIGSAITNSTGLPHWSAAPLDLFMAWNLDPVILGGKVVQLSHVLKTEEFLYRETKLGAALGRAGGRTIGRFLPNAFTDAMATLPDRLWASQVRRFIEQPQGGVWGGLVPKALRTGDTLSQEAVDVILHSKTPELAYARLTGRYWARYGAEGIDPRFAKAAFRVTRALAKTGVGEATLAKTYDEMLLAGFGVKPFAGSAAQAFMEDASRTINPELARDVLDSQAQVANFADQADEMNRVAVSGIIDEAAQQFGMVNGVLQAPHVLHEIPQIRASRTIARNLLSSPLFDNPVGRAARATFTRTPGYTFRLEDTAIPYYEQVNRYLRRARVDWSADQIDTEVSKAQTVSDPLNPSRDQAFLAHSQSLIERVFENVAHQLGYDPEFAREIARQFAARTRGVNGELYRQAYPEFYGHLGPAKPGEDLSSLMLRTPVVETQLVNEVFLPDPLVVRKVLARNLGTFRRLRQGVLRAVGRETAAHEFTSLEEASRFVEQTVPKEFRTLEDAQAYAEGNPRVIGTPRLLANGRYRLRLRRADIAQKPYREGTVWRVETFRYSVQALAKVPVYRMARNFADLIEHEFYRFWKPLTVLRPAYVLRAPGLEENARTIARLGLLGKLRGFAAIGKRIPDDVLHARQVGLFGEGFDPLEREVRALGFDSVRDAVAAVDAGDQAIIDILGPDLTREIRKVAEGKVRSIDARIPALSYPGKEGLAATRKTQNMLETVDYHQKIEESRIAASGFEPIHPDNPMHIGDWAHDLQLQLGQSVLGRMALEQVAARLGEGLPYEAEINARRDALLAQFEASPEAQRALRRLPIDERNPEELAIQAERLARLARAYTVDLPDIAQAVLDGDGESVYQALEAVPPGQRPIVHGPRLRAVSGREGNIWDRYVQTMGRWLFQLPHDVLNRQPFYRAWQDRFFKAIIRQADDAGVTVGEDFTYNAHQEARRLALQETYRTLIDFGDQSRIGEMMGFLAPFFHPWEDFVIKWGRLIRDNPALVGYAINLDKLGWQSGFFHRDPDTGETVIPTTWFLGAAGLLQFATHAKGWQLMSPLSGFQLFFSDTLHLPTGSIGGELPVPIPSLGPGAMWAIQKLLETKQTQGILPERWRLALESWAFKYGETGGWNLLPRYLHYAIIGLGDKYFGQDWGKGEIDSATEEFLRYQQMRGTTPEKLMAEQHISRDRAEAELRRMARDQAESFYVARTFMSAFLPSAPEIRFPTAALEDEYQRLVEKVGPIKARDQFNSRYDNRYDLIATAKTLWAGVSPVPLPATKAAAELLKLPGFSEFAQQHPRWAWAIMPWQVRDGTFDSGVWFEQLATGERQQTSPEQFQQSADISAAWDSYFATKEAWVARQDYLKGQGVSETDPLWLADEQTYWEEPVKLLAQTYPAWARKYGPDASSATFTLGLEPGVLAEARRLVKDPLFMQFPVGKAVRDYLGLRDRVYGELRDANISSIARKDARTAGIAQEYNQGVTAIRQKYEGSGFADAYRVFFANDLTRVQTAGRTLLGHMPPGDYQAFSSFRTKLADLSSQLDAVTDPADRPGIYIQIRNLMNSAYGSAYDQKYNPATLWWDSRTPGERQDYVMRLEGRPMVFWSRFDRQTVLGIPTNDQAEQQWLTIGQGLAQIQQLQSQGLTGTAQFYRAIDLEAQAFAAENPVFAQQLAASNTWGYAFSKLSPYLDPGHDTSSSWRALLDSVANIETVASAEQLTGVSDPDPQKRLMYTELRQLIVGQVDEMRTRSPQFDREWTDLQSVVGDALTLFVPDSFFPLGGFPARTLPLGA